MSEIIRSFLVEHLSFLPQEILVIIVSAAPILELRGGLPLAQYYGFPYWEALGLALFGNLLPIIPLLLLFQPISSLLRRFEWYDRLYGWLYRRTMSKSRNVQRFGAVGLVLFTAIPFPTTGAYGACFAAAFFAIKFRYALPAVVTGVLIAGFAVSLTLYSIF